jgi:hypothetical protein
MIMRCLRQVCGGFGYAAWFDGCRLVLINVHRARLQGLQVSPVLKLLQQWLCGSVAQLVLHHGPLGQRLFLH